MSYSYRIKGARWLRLWTAAERSSVYAAQSDAQKIADTLCDVPWTRAESDGPAMFPLTGAKSLDENPANRDLFDAALFCAEHADGAHRAYANAAIYLFALPAAAQGVGLEAVKVHVESDAYNALGARIAVHLLSSPTLPTDCATVRTGAAYAQGAAPRRTVARNGTDYWFSSSEDVTIAMPADTRTTAYLAVFVGLENYAVSRNEWLEGASYIRNSVVLETTEEIDGWTDGSSETVDCSGAGPAVLLAGGSSPTWLQPLPTVNVGEEAPAYPATSPVRETFFSDVRYENVPMEYTRTFQSSTTHWACKITARFKGTTFVGATAEGWGASTTGGVYAAPPFSADLELVGNGLYACVSPEACAGLYLVVKMSDIRNVSTNTGDTGRTEMKARIVIYENSEQSLGAAANSSTVDLDYSFSATTGFRHSPYYVCVVLENGVLVDGDICGFADADGRQHWAASIASASASNITWTMVLTNDAQSRYYNVYKSGASVVLRLGLNTTTATYQLGSWTSAYATNTVLFDAAARIRMPGETANGAVRDYGLAATVGDFSHAVATFEAGTQPPDGELLGRLARMSRAATGEILYLHPESGALADELDVLRPVPRFWRAASDPTGQTACQPGLSVWYRRPAASTAAVVFAYRDATVAVTKVTNPAFLQLALLSLRAPSAFASRIVLGNVGQAAVHNGFVLRFVAWRCPAEQWVGSNGFAMAAMASMPSVYRSDGPSEVSWAVDCTGALLRFGVRNMTAERVGVSQAVPGDIAANAQIAIPLVASVGAGDVVLIAPEVLGFADGTGAASVHFGRQDEPSQGTPGWARYAHNLGWFPRVTGE